MRTEAKTELVAWLDDEARDADSLDEGLRLVREALAAERHTTVERIRRVLIDATPRGAMGVDWLVILRILDEEAAR